MFNGLSHPTPAIKNPSNRLIHKSITLTHCGYEIHQRNHQGIDGPLPIHNRPDLWDAARRLAMVRGHWKTGCREIEERSGGRGDCQREMIIPTSVLARLFFPLELVCDSWRNRFRSNSNCSLHFWFCSRRCWFCSSSCGGNQSIPGGTPARKGEGERGKKENCLKWRETDGRKKKGENKFFSGRATSYCKN
jgi:hypothetical protein